MLNYAVNPNKTENPNADELKLLMNYAENPNKTEKHYLVSGINCLPELAYERMTETKRRYGKRGGIVAYHGYMSFKHGEVTPDECHNLGIELAKRLWGDRFEVLVATHVDHDHLHNHFVVNSVSFKDGKKFRCTKSYHDCVMATESDRLCLEHGLSVIHTKNNRRAPYVTYMAEKKGKLSHRTMLRLDIDNAIAECIAPMYFKYALEARGYTYIRDGHYKHPCVMAKGWERPVRIDSLGKRYTTEAIEGRIMSMREFHGLYKPRKPPLYDALESKRYERYSAIELVFVIVLELLGFDTSGRMIADEMYQEPLSPAMRQEQMYIDRYLQTVNLINRNDLSTEEKVEEYILRKESEMRELLSARNSLDNYRRRHKDTDCSQKRKTLTEEIRTLRHDINLAKDIFPLIERLKEKLRIEIETERQLMPIQTNTKIRRNEEIER